MLTVKATYQMCRSVFHKSLFCLLAFILALSLCASGFFRAGSAYAITENTEAELTETQKHIEETAVAYDEAVVNLEAVESEIEETQAKILELEASITEQQRKSNEASISLYKWYGNGFSIINLLLDAGSLLDFTNSFEYITSTHQSLYNEINRLNALKRELEETNDFLIGKKLVAENKKVIAEEALIDAQAAREAAQKKAEEEAVAEAEAAALAIAAAQAQEEAEKAKAENPVSSDNTVNVSVSSISDVDWSSDKADFVDHWGARIDAYLTGSPLAGQGRTFAAAAWDYGVDPRYSPAISFIESSRGLYCFKPYNAWGWGHYSWSSWEEAIYAHVGGLSRGYSYTICISDAQKYCENWESWYNTTLNQIGLI